MKSATTTTLRVETAAVILVKWKKDGTAACTVQSKTEATAQGRQSPLCSAETELSKEVKSVMMGSLC